MRWARHGLNRAVDVGVHVAGEGRGYVERVADDVDGRAESIEADGPGAMPGAVAQVRFHEHLFVLLDGQQLLRQRHGLGDFLVADLVVWLPENPLEQLEGDVHLPGTTGNIGEIEV